MTNKQIVHSQINPSFEAEAVLAKHLAVVLTTTENGTNLTPANSPYFIGTTMHQAQTGDMVAIDTGTFILGVSGGVFAVGANLKTTATGKFVVATTGDNVVAKAVRASTATDQIVEIMKVPTFKA